jgi:hypothetical protein
MRTISHLYRHSDGIELDCELEYDPGQTADEINPPFPPAAYLIAAKVGGVDILPLLGNALAQSIEESAIWSQGY